MSDFEWETDLPDSILFCPSCGWIGTEDAAVLRLEGTNPIFCCPTCKKDIKCSGQDVAAAVAALHNAHNNAKAEIEDNAKQLTLLANVEADNARLQTLVDDARANATKRLERARKAENDRKCMENGLYETVECLKVVLIKLERQKQYTDDACECARCCECQGWNPDCSILAAKKKKAEKGTFDKAPHPEDPEMIERVE